MATKSTPSPLSPPVNKAANLRKMPRTLAGNPQPAADAHRTSSIALYETALKLLHAGKYDKAHDAFNKLLETSPPDLGDRIRMYIAACVTQISKGTTEFRSHEERYDYAISLLNHGHYEDAREHFQAILLKDDSAHYAFYGLALMASMTGDPPKCIEHLAEAIRLNPGVRFQARGDSDFEAVSDDPMFTELLYPEP